MTPEAVTALLVALGSTPDDVAGALRAGGFRGHRTMPIACPLARYLTAQGVPDVRVMEVVEWPTGLERPARQFVKLPPACLAFVVGLHTGSYADLVETP